MEPSEIDALPDYTPGQLLKQVNRAIAVLLGSPNATVTVRERAYTFHDMDKLRRWRDELQREAASEEGSYSSVALARFGRPQL